MGNNLYNKSTKLTPSPLPQELSREKPRTPPTEKQRLPTQQSAGNKPSTLSAQVEITHTQKGATTTHSTVLLTKARYNWKGAMLIANAIVTQKCPQQLLYNKASP